MKTNKIRGDVYNGIFWNDFISRHNAKSIAHKQNRAKNKSICRNALTAI